MPTLSLFEPALAAVFLLKFPARGRSSGEFSSRRRRNWCGTHCAGGKRSGVWLAYSNRCPFYTQAICCANLTADLSDGFVLRTAGERGNSVAAVRLL
ncbi:hypothetical protein [Kamptonema formosum]|uniref:hypothetical protein n=1 Tax=Kamptonema formosum TaxID=331992 RepID=UPI0012DBFC86|nr:hypothetical protein [Oscillatoria sp. PCC 10802]